MRIILLSFLPACVIFCASVVPCAAQWTQNKVDTYGRFGPQSLGTFRQPGERRMVPGILRGPNGSFLGRARPYRGMMFDSSLPLYGNVGPTEVSPGVPRPAPPPEIPRVIPPGQPYPSYRMPKPQRPIPNQLATPRLETPRWKPPRQELPRTELPKPAPRPFRIPQTNRKSKPADTWFRGGVDETAS